MHSFSYDEDRALLTVVQQGYWSMADFRSYEREFLDRHAEIRKKQRHYRVLADCRDYPVQSGEVTDAFGAMFTTLMAENSARYAIVAASTLNKIQARRALPFANIQLFTDFNEAMAWLLESNVE